MTQGNSRAHPSAVCTQRFRASIKSVYSSVCYQCWIPCARPAQRSRRSPQGVQIPRVRRRGRKKGEKADRSPTIRARADLQTPSREEGHLLLRAGLLSTPQDTRNEKRGLIE